MELFFLLKCSLNKFINLKAGLCELLDLPNQFFFSNDHCFFELYVLYFFVRAFPFGIEAANPRGEPRPHHVFHFLGFRHAVVDRVDLKNQLLVQQGIEIVNLSISQVLVVDLFGHRTNEIFAEVTVNESC